MKKEKNKSIIIIFIVAILFLSATYAYFNLSVSNNTATGEGGCFEVNYTGQEIDESALKSTVNYAEGAYSEITLSKNEDCEIYTTAEIYIHTDSETTAPLAEPLKYIILNEGTTVAEGSILEELTEEGDYADVLLATVPLTEEEVIYDIYIWIDSSISNGIYNNTTYTGYLYAKSTQTSTVVDDETTE